MGKIRVKVLGDEQAEKQQKEEARKRVEAKKLEARKQAGVTDVAEEKTETPKETRKVVKKKVDASGPKHSTKYQAVAGKVEKNKTYSLKEAVSLLPTLQRTKFDETVELHINTTVSGISGNVTLPHGTGKKMRIMIANQSGDAKNVEELIKKVESGVIDFDVLLATPDTMPKLARIARYLGPRGLMPNPKNGTITQKPEEAAKKFEGGQINFKTEAKFPLLHLSVGKVSFGDEKISENIKAAMGAVELKNVKSITLKSTMSPGIRIDITTI
jgi:large subunit ribosomal protein L1